MSRSIFRTTSAELRGLIRPSETASRCQSALRSTVSKTLALTDRAAQITPSFDQASVPRLVHRSLFPPFFALVLFRSSCREKERVGRARNNSLAPYHQAEQ